MNNLVSDLVRWSKQEAIAPGTLREAAITIKNMRCEIESLQSRLKRYEPIDTYDGLTIDQWQARAEIAAGMLDAAQSMLKYAFGDQCDEFNHECEGCQAWRLISRIETFLTERKAIRPLTVAESD